MKPNSLKRMAVLVVSAMSLAGMSIPANAQQQPQEEQKQPHKQQQQERSRQQSEQDQKRQQQHQQERARQQAQEEQRKQQKETQEKERLQRQSEERDERREREAEQQERRISRQQQQQRIHQQQQEVTQYRRYLEQQESRAREQAEELRRQNRLAQYRYQEEYLEHLREQQRRLRDERFDYDRDPYFYAAPIYRYRRDGRYYEINRYGANVLRQALNAGYAQGFRAGEADRRDRWRAAYRDSYAYRDASYGYRGYYISRSEYNYYFREGFRRGYEDGYNSRHRYGRYSNGNYFMSDNILSQILNFQAIR
jgi:hypothetical protein